ncbi:MAG: DUF2207 domain-containing protein [Patescibacteria group bacterium]
MKKLFIAFILFFVFLPAPQAFAEKINSFDVFIVSHKDGKMDVSETINYDFEYGDRHGIYRYIPTFSKVGDLYRIIKIDNVNVERDEKTENFETSKNKEQIYFKIGNADKTITGKHVYKISYTVENGIGSNFPDHDEIYWNATGNDWQVEIDKASISFDTDFGLKPTSLICFEGALGAKDKTCTVEGSKVTSGQTLNPGYGLTAVAVYPKGTFPASYLVRELPNTFGEKIAKILFDNLHIIWVFPNIILSLILIIWYQKNKNKKRFGNPAVNFDIPKDEKGERLIPAISGTIDSAELERDDVVATLFDLAIRRYLKLVEEKISKTLGIIGSGKKQKIIKLKDADESFSRVEKTLFERLFKDGDQVYADELKLDFYKTFQEMEKEVFNDLVQKKYFVKNPKFQRGMLFVLGLVAIGTANLILGVVLIYLARKLIGRTALGDEIDFKIDGLKLFLKSMDRNYKWQAEKFYMVEHMIPYAMALGYIDKFMEQLKIINPDYNPSWYHGYSGSFYGAYAGFYSSVNSNITTSAPSSSSGSSGGSSGGGGGGGGGGSW